MSAAVPGTDRHDCDDVDERGVSPGTTSRGRPPKLCSPTTTPPDVGPPSVTLAALYSSDIMISGDVL